MVRRVTRILEAAGDMKKPRVWWLAIPVALVAIAAPRVTADEGVRPASATRTTPAIPGHSASAEQREPRREWTAAEIAAARAQVRVHRVDRPGASLDDRWRQALADAGRQGINDFWFVYTFSTPVHADRIVMSDTKDGNTWISSDGRISFNGPPLAALINPGGVNLEGGNIAVLLHYRGARADAIDRASYRSVQLGFDFGRTPVFWLGEAGEAESFARAERLFHATRNRELQVFWLEVASMHGNSNAVIPFLSRLVEPAWPAEIRSEAAEGFEHHHDPRSVEVLLRVARSDGDTEVRSEAAEAIGEVQVPQSIPALTDLATQSTDAAVRQEAAEAFGSQPASQALPAIERLIDNNHDDEVVAEAIEAIGEIADPASLSLLVRIVNTHPNRVARQEAVETLGDLHELPGVVDALERIIREHDDEDVRAEAIETLSDAGESMHALILDLAVSGSSARIRSEALEAIGNAVPKVADTQLLDRAQQVIERVVFSDVDRGVQEDALDALEEFPNDRALAVLRDVIARHPDARIRREAEEHLRERQ